jgi:hypothetical protein
MWCVLAVILCAGTYAGVVLATPGSGFSATTLAVARFDEIDVKNFTLPANSWQARLKTQGLSDVYVQSNLWVPGGTTGWHTHPGHSLILVTEGAVTVYEGNDPDCTPQVYTEGMGLVDHGGSHVHLIRNETSDDARTIAIQLIPAAAVRRIDAPAPGNCSF